MYRIEDTYWWYRGMREIARILIPELFQSKTLIRVLDAGCGTGARLQHLVETGDWGPESRPRRVGVDLFLEGLRFCKMRKLDQLVQASVEDLPFRNETFDFVTSYDVLVCVPDDEKAIREYYRVCRPGGKVFLTVAAFDWLWGEHDRAGQVVRRYTEPELRQKLQEAGFTVERATYANTFLLLPIFLLRKAVNLLGPAKTDQEAASDFHFTPVFLNTILTYILYLEAYLLQWVRFPVGVTLLVKARKNEPVDERR